MVLWSCNPVCQKDTIVRYCLCRIRISSRPETSNLLQKQCEYAQWVAKKRITFEVPEETHRRLKLLCFTDGYTIGEVLNQLVNDFCDLKEADMIQLIDNRNKK